MFIPDLDQDLKTGSGSDHMLKTGSDHILKTGSGSGLISKPDPTKTPGYGSETLFAILVV